MTGTSSVIPARTLRSHLFPGAHVQLLGDTGPPIRPLGIRLRFGDGSVSDAELLVGDDENLPIALSVGAYRTRAGTELEAALWAASVTGVGDTGAELTVGRRLRDSG